MSFLAHPENADRTATLLKDHLRSVGALARRFAETANPWLVEPAQWAGMLHDLGKYRDEFRHIGARNARAARKRIMPCTVRRWLASGAGPDWRSPLPAITPDCMTSASCSTG